MKIETVRQHQADEVVGIHEVADTISCLLDNAHACWVGRIDDKTVELTLVNNDGEVHSKCNAELVGTALQHLCPTKVQVQLPEFGEYEPLLVRLLMAYDDNWAMPYLTDEETQRIVKWAKKRNDEMRYAFS